MILVFNNIADGIQKPTIFIGKKVLDILISHILIKKLVDVIGTKSIGCAIYHLGNLMAVTRINFSTKIDWWFTGQ